MERIQNEGVGLRRKRVKEDTIGKGEGLEPKSATEAGEDETHKWKRMSP